MHHQSQQQQQRQWISKRLRTRLLMALLALVLVYTVLMQQPSLTMIRSARAGADTRPRLAYGAVSLYYSADVMQYRHQTRQLHTNKTVTLRSLYNSQGYASFYNLVISTMQYAHLTNKTFRLDTRDFAYCNHNDFFEPVLGDIAYTDDDTADIAGQRDALQEIKYDTATQQYREVVNNDQLLLVPWQSDMFMKIRFAFHHAYSAQYPLVADQIEHRRTVAQGMWELNQAMRSEFDKLMASARSNGHLLTVHYRRGDKIQQGESRQVAPQEYVDAVVNQTAMHREIGTVVLISDDDVGVLELATKIVAAVSSSVRVRTWRQLRSTVDGSQESNNSHGWQQYAYGDLSKEQRRKHTQDMILSLTAMAHSDYTVCTHSSNICRLVQVLRSRPQGTLTSIDGDWEIY